MFSLLQGLGSLSMFLLPEWEAMIKLPSFSAPTAPREMEGSRDFTHTSQFLLLLYFFSSFHLHFISIYSIHQPQPLLSLPTTAVVSNRIRTYCTYQVSSFCHLVATALPKWRRQASLFHDPSRTCAAWRPSTHFPSSTSCPAVVLQCCLITKLSSSQ